MPTQTSRTSGVDHAMASVVLRAPFSLEPRALTCHMGYHGPQTTAEREFSRITESRSRDSRLRIGTCRIGAPATALSFEAARRVTGHCHGPERGRAGYSGTGPRAHSIQPKLKQEIYRCRLAQA
jgi:hypothetical protein